ncbi:MAG: MotA/TolQ/ExbB proton channel family protein [Myxococcales bacterium]|nr:MotA/TolQ/ExbB proton channel family protein [Myxococcales bacterium]
MSWIVYVFATPQQKQLELSPSYCSSLCNLARWRIPLTSIQLVLAVSLGLLPKLALAQPAPTPTPKPATVDPAALERAYLKELAFLKAEKKALLQRKTDLQRRRDQHIRKATAEVEKIERDALGLREQANQVEQTLIEAERSDANTSKLDLLLETLSRGREPVEAAGFTVPALPKNAGKDPGKLVPTLEALFQGIAKLLRVGGQQTTLKDTFYTEDGTQVEGKVQLIGQVAAVGVSSSASGALAPAGGGRLKIWPDPAVETANALIKREPKDFLRLFLFESTETAVARKKEKTFSSVMKAGGAVGWVIVSLGFAAVLMAAIRALTLLMQGASTTSLVNKVLPDVAAKRLDTAKAMVDLKRGATARVLQVTIANLDRPRDILEDAVQEALLDESPAIERFGTAISVIAAVAPLLGLLGTVTGMIATFDVITEFGTGDPRMLSGGISEALITTQLGLIVAIPSLLLGNLLTARADALLGDIEQAALRIVNAYRGLGSPAHGRVGAPDVPQAE